MPRSLRRIVPVGLLVLGLLMVAATADVGGLQLSWSRAQLTFAAVFGACGCLVVARSAFGRAREVMSWITAAMAVWAVAELIRDVEYVQTGRVVTAAGDLALLAILPLTAMAYRAALRGRLSRTDEIAVYLDAAIVFLATAAALLIVFGTRAEHRPNGLMDLANATFFLATALAALLLDMALLAERRLRGAYLILAGILLLGGGFLWQLVAPISDGAREAGLSQYFLSTGLVVVMLGTVTWNSLVDRHPTYVRVAARVRSALPVAAVLVAPILLVLMLLQPGEGKISEAIGVSALGLLLATVAIRQTLLLRGRESAARRETDLLRNITEAESKYRVLVEQQPGVVYLAEPGALGRWHYVSPQIEAMFGFAPEEWTGGVSLWLRQLHPDDRDRVLMSDAAAGDAGRPYRLEYRILSRDGREVWVLDDLNPSRSDSDRPGLLQGMLLDITEQKRSEAALRASEEQLRVIIETASYAFVGMDESGCVVEWNQQAERVFGWTRREVLTQPLDELIIPAAQREAHRAGLKHYLATGDGPILSTRIEVSALHRDGHQFPVDLTIWPVRTAGPVRFSALVDDITVRKQLEEQLRHQALHDPLTGLANRVLFTDRLDRALAVAPTGEDGSVAVLFIDLDDFKNVNQGIGRQGGDELLVAVAKRIGTGLRPADTAARVGGEEFAVLLDQADHARPARLGARLLRLIAEPFQIHGTEVRITASIGIALHGAEGMTAEELLRNANLAMSAAKTKGRGGSELYRGRMHREAVRRLELKAALELAIAEESLEVHYQPIVRLADGLVTGFEALLRWFDQNDEPVSLAEVIPIAEESGLIVPIGRMVLRQACLEASTWRVRPITGAVDVAVNISAAQFENGSLVADVRAALEESGLPPSSLILEMTESALIQESVPTIRSLRELRALGVRLALDDFGTGYSSLSHLRRFPIDIVKIDRSFVAGVTRKGGAGLVRSIVDLGRTMNKAIIAEGIETAAQHKALQAMDCALGQGFLFARAMPAAMAREILEVGRLPERPVPSQRSRSA